MISRAVSEGAAPLDFVLYVPGGYGAPNGTSVPNVEETENPGKILSVSFNQNREVYWKTA